MARKVTVDQEKCIGCGNCQDVCPDVFAIEDDGKSHVKKGAPLDKECVKEAAENCPVEAITVEE
jgi:ferredoxin